MRRFLADVAEAIIIGILLSGALHEWWERHEARRVTAHGG